MKIFVYGENIVLSQKWAIVACIYPTSSHSMMMEEFEYGKLIKQSNEEQKLTFDDIMYGKKSYCNSPICLFFMRGVGIGKTFTLKLVIQGLLWLYIKNTFSNLIKTNALLMASVGKATFKIDGWTIHSTLNILVQQSLSNLPNL